MGVSERQLMAWQCRMSARLAKMIEDPGDHAVLEIRHAIVEGQALYHELRDLEAELGRSLEQAYFPQRLHQLETRYQEARARVRGLSPEELVHSEMYDHVQQISGVLEGLAAQAGTTVPDLLVRGAEALAEGRIKRRPGPPKGRRLKPPSDGPWTPQVLKAEMERLQISFERMGAALDPPCGGPSVYKWLTKGIPSARQDQITSAIEEFERGRENNKK